MSLVALKFASLFCLGAAMATGAFGALVLRDTAIHRLVRQHVARLNALSARSFGPPNGAKTTKIQALLTLVVIALMALIGLHAFFASIALILIWSGPYIELEQRRRQRIARIEESVATFGMALANSLRSSGNIGRALDRIRSVVPESLADELTVVQQELQLGVSIEESLSNLGSRVGSVTLDLMLSGILIGRQVGGNLPDILETNSASIREMARIQGVIRSKTAESKGQLWVLGLAPPVIFLAFDSLQPGYFDPLSTTTAGPIVLAIALLLWLASLLSAKRILMVDV